MSCAACVCACIWPYLACEHKTQQSKAQNMCACAYVFYMYYTRLCMCACAHVHIMCWMRCRAAARGISRCVLVTGVRTSGPAVVWVCYVLNPITDGKKRLRHLLHSYISSARRLSPAQAHQHPNIHQTPKAQGMVSHTLVPLPLPSTKAPSKGEQIPEGGATRQVLK
jgi:hypothetical protein